MADNGHLSVRQGFEPIMTPYLEELAKKASVYSAIIDFTKTDPNEMVSYADGAKGIAKGWAAWKDKPIFKDLRNCLLQNGEVLYYLDPNDLTKKEDGSAADTSTYGIDTMLEIPYRIGYKIDWMDEGRTKLKVSITKEPAADGFCYDAFSLDSENDCDRIYIGTYKAYDKNGLIYSKRGETLTGNMAVQFRSKANKRGSGYLMTTFGIHTLFQCLYLICHGNLDSQAAVGMGCVNRSNGAQRTGGTDQLGFDFELATEAQRTDGVTQVKCLGVEDPWGNQYEFIGGVSTDTSKNYYIVRTASTIGTSLTNWTNLGQIGGSARASGFIARPQGGIAGFIPVAYSEEPIGTLCDFGSTQEDSAPKAGGYYNSGTGAGIFEFDTSTSSGSYSTSTGARLCYMHKEVV